MNQILDKLGIYDLIGVLLSGLCITTFSVAADKLFFHIQLETILDPDDTLSFFVVSYVIGVVFQELSSQIQKNYLDKGDKILASVVNSGEQYHQYLTEEEKQRIRKIAAEDMEIKNPDDTILYNYCKFYLADREMMGRIDRDQSVFGMSRSLSLYFLLLGIFLLVNGTVKKEAVSFWGALAVFVFSVLMYKRCIRFMKIRYSNIFRTFYYHRLHKGKNSSLSIGPDAPGE